MSTHEQLRAETILRYARHALRRDQTDPFIRDSLEIIEHNARLLIAGSAAVPAASSAGVSPAFASLVEIGAREQGIKHTQPEEMIH